MRSSKRRQNIVSWHIKVRPKYLKQVTLLCNYVPVGIYSHKYDEVSTIVPKSTKGRLGLFCTNLDQPAYEKEAD